MMGRLGFSVNEIMLGTHVFIDGSGATSQRPLLINLTWGSVNILEFFNPKQPGFLKATVRGIITLSELVHKAPCTGTLEWQLRGERKIVYTLDFKDGQTNPYRFYGEKKHIQPWNLLALNCTCFGTITELRTGKAVTHTEAVLPWRALPALIHSVRLNKV